MQDIELGPKPSSKFQLKQSPEMEIESRPFLIMPESSDVRKQAVFAFDQEIREKAEEKPSLLSQSGDLPPVPQDIVSAEVQVKAEISLYIYNSETLLKNNENSLARALMVKALQLDPFHIGALKQLSKCFNETTELASKIKIYEQLVKVDYSFETFVQMGHLHYKAGHNEMAKQFYFDGLGLLVSESFELFEVYKNLGNILVKEGDFEGAEEYYNKAFTLNPDSDQLHVNLGTLEVQKNDFSSALERFRRAVNINSSNDKAWVGLALVHNHMGDLQLARANIEKALDLNISNRTAVHLYVNWSQDEKSVDQGIERLQQYLAQVDSDKEMSLVLIHLYCMTNELNLALLEIERVLLWHPDATELIDLERQIRQQMGAQNSAQ
ncbi:MAG: hypothetical protein BroJett040_05330 [Oligoflexia bacterium]|nr:MAG: hypothetical protein BroJett040_05330 [Oligoflexia bacterium]